MMNRTKARPYPIRFALFLSAYYITNAIFQGYMSVYYDSAIGLTSAQIGSINATIAAVSVFFQPFWGMRADRCKSRAGLLRLLALGAAAAMFAYLLSDKFFILLILAGLYSCFFTSIQPLGDSIILASLEKHGEPFGPIRQTAGLAFAVVSLTFGWLMNTNINKTIIVLAVGVLCLMMIPCTFVLPQLPGYQSQGNRLAFHELLKRKQTVTLLLFMLPLMVTLGYFYTFFSPHFLSLEGANSKLLGWCYFISAVSEVPFLLNSDKLHEKLGSGIIMCGACVTLTVRWLLLASTHNYIVAMCSQVLHSWSFAMMTVAVSKHIARTVPKELQASGQTLLAIVSFGLARFIGALGGGFLAQNIGRQNVFYVLAGITVVTFIVFAPRYLHFGHKKLKG